MSTTITEDDEWWQLCQALLRDLEWPIVAPIGNLIDGTCACCGHVEVVMESDMLCGRCRATKDLERART